MRILLIEDDLATVKSIEIMLRSEDLCVDATDLGEDGIDLARRYDYDAIILDLRLPDMSGFDVIRAIRKAEVHTPILVLSGNTLPESPVKALDFGADGYVTKPFHKEELIVRIRALVRRSRGHANSAITTGPVTINLAAKTVTASGKDVRLSGKEYQVLELLSLRRGATLSKDTLINHLYGDADGPDSRTVELFVCRLRKKLAEATGGDRCIETVGRYGYLLRPRAA
jgi:two-component system cell cycle response regulator CtrA